jgi:hypothetical protein
MITDADLVGLTQEQTRRCQELDKELSQTREGIAVWHRLLDRRRLDRKLGLHPIVEFAAAEAPAGGGEGRLTRKGAAEDDGRPQREPFYVSSEAEARALLVRAIGYLSNEAGDKLAFDKGYGDRDKMVEWIMKEIDEHGGIAYIRRHSPYVFGIPLAAASA